MKRNQIAFFAAGLIAGLISASFGSWASPEIMILGLTYAVGPLFFLAIIAGIILTGSHFKHTFARYALGFVVCTISYFGALIAFFGVAGFSPEWFGFRRSANLVDFGIDVWLGLIAAAVVAAGGIAVFAALFKGEWSNAVLVRLIFNLTRCFLDSLRRSDERN